MTQITKRLMALAPAAAALVLAAGCNGVAGEPEGRAADKFMDQGEVSHVTRLADQQIASGARTDGTLRPYHFNGAALNSLGREKLDAMLAADGEGDGEMVVYLDVPRGEGDAAARLAEARHNAVNEYLASQGVAEESFRLESGYNSNVTSAVVSLKPVEAETGASEKAFGEGFGKGLGDVMAKQQK